MGGSISSQTLYNSTMDIAASALMQNIQECSSKVSAIQDVSVEVNTGINISFFNSNKQTVKLTQTCMLEAISASTLSATLTTALEQAAEASGTDLLTSGEDATTASSIQNRISSAISQENINKAVAEIMAQQDAHIAVKNGVNISFFVMNNQEVTSIVKSVITSSMSSDVVAEICNEVTQSAESTGTSPLDFISSIYKYLTVGIIILLIVIALLIGVPIAAIIYSFRRRAKEKQAKSA